MQWIKKTSNEGNVSIEPNCLRCRCKKSGCRVNNPFFCFAQVNIKPCPSLVCVIQAGS